MAHAPLVMSYHVQRDGNSLFYAVSNCIHTKNRHSEVRLCTVNKIIKEWEHYKDFIVDLSIVNIIALKIAKIFLPEMGNIYLFIYLNNCTIHNNRFAVLHE